jgi:hypothetical protein
MATALSWVVCTVLMFLEFGVLACSALGGRKRSRFYLRLGCASVVMLGLALGLGFAIAFNTLPQRSFGAAWGSLLLAALAVAPVFCYDTLALFRDSSDGDGDGGPGRGPPPPPPAPPPGGAPLPDADQSRARRRDHNRPSLRGVNRRRPAVDPPPRRVPAAPRRR